MHLLLTPLAFFCTILLFEALDSNGMSGIHKFIFHREQKKNLDFSLAQKGGRKNQQTMARRKKRLMRFEIFIMSFLRFKVLFRL